MSVCSWGRKQHPESSDLSINHPPLISRNVSRCASIPNCLNTRTQSYEVYFPGISARRLSRRLYLQLDTLQVFPEFLESFSFSTFLIQEKRNLSLLRSDRLVCFGSERRDSQLLESWQERRRSDQLVSQLVRQAGRPTFSQPLSYYLITYFNRPDRLSP